MNTQAGNVSHKTPHPPEGMRIGIELEGAWDSEPRDSENYHSDSSVHVRGSWRSGEIVSDILDPSDWQSVRDFITGNYPDRAGPSCGLHVHFSFGERGATCSAAEKLKREDILDFILSRLGSWGKRHAIKNDSFWARLRGENTYCKRGAWRDGDRYHAVNFEALHAHGTIEIRVLSAFYHSSAAVSAVAELVRIMSILYNRVCIGPAHAPAGAVEIVETAADIAMQRIAEYDREAEFMRIALEDRAARDAERDAMLAFIDRMRLSNLTGVSA